MVAHLNYTDTLFSVDIVTFFFVAVTNTEFVSCEKKPRAVWLSSIEIQQ